MINGMRLVVDSPFAARPIVSHGLQIQALNTGRWAIVQRKHSAEYIMLLRGSYRRSHLSVLLPSITQREADRVRAALNNPPVFAEVASDELRMLPSEIEYGYSRLRENHQLITDLLNKFDHTNNTLQWTWPKGQIEFSNCSTRETPLACALREAAEELEIDLPLPVVTGTTFNSIVSKTPCGRVIEVRSLYYAIPEEIPLEKPHPNHPEVTDRKWVSSDELAILLPQVAA
jgi:ADP-ribose pyrophosphatase YjhB (NUDIX family)